MERLVGFWDVVLEKVRFRLESEGLMVLFERRRQQRRLIREGMKSVGLRGSLDCSLMRWSNRWVDDKRGMSGEISKVGRC